MSHETAQPRIHRTLEFPSLPPWPRSRYWSLLSHWTGDPGSLVDVEWGTKNPPPTYTIFPRHLLKAN